MTFAEAYANVTAFLNNELEGTTADLITSLHVLEDANMVDLVEEIYEEYPILANWDNNGNWVGPMSNENGWTQ